MSSLMRCLLDKVVARRATEGLLKLAEGRSLTEEELCAVDLLHSAAPRQIQLFISPASNNVLTRLQGISHYSSIIQTFLSRTEVAVPSRYFKRWSRRVRGFGFTPEDARVLALASFGTNEEHEFLGMPWFATYDRALMNLWDRKHSEIEKRLTAMRRQLSPPYDQVRLPEVERPEYIAPL